MLLRSLFLLLIITILSGCKIGQPKANPRPECALIKTGDILQDYLYCVWTDTNQEYRVRLSEIPEKPQNDEEAYVCTTLKGYIELKKYEVNLQSWINQNCRR